jgi:hypothetical protein
MIALGPKQTSVVQIAAVALESTNLFYSISYAEIEGALRLFAQPKVVYKDMLENPGEDPTLFAFFPILPNEADIMDAKAVGHYAKELFYTIMKSYVEGNREPVFTYGEVVVNA